jgi:hypothetical protein
MRLNLHEGQLEAWESRARVTAVLAGTQGGKTSFGPPWLYREIQEKGPGDYFVVTPTFPLLQLKALPEFLRFFGELLDLGTYTASPVKVFRFSEEGARRTFGADAASGTTTNVYFGHAQDPDSLESATAKAAWMDEAGQKKFKLESWRAVWRRLSLAMGRILITTTVYNLGWLKTEVYDKWKAGDEDYRVVSFDSIANPLFPPAEYERARRDLPRWKFDMMYRGRFTRPAGLIHECFASSKHKVPRFRIPDEWPRYLGLDFGGVNTAGLFYAEELSPDTARPTGRLFLYREYKAGGRTAKQHAEHLLKGEPMVPTCVGGSRSEGQWRNEFRSGGLPVMEPPISDVEVGIDRVYGAHARGEIFAFEDLAGYLEEKLTYSRPLDENGEPTEGIEDKETFHFMDAERYIVSHLRNPESAKATVYSF